MYDMLTRDEFSDNERKMVQKVAEALYAVATSNNHHIAWCRSDTYRNLENALNEVLSQTYHTTAAQNTIVRDMMDELGPYDSARDESGTGIESYVNFAFTNTLPAGYKNLSSADLYAVMAKMSTDYAFNAVTAIRDELDRREYCCPEHDTEIEMNASCDTCGKWAQDTTDYSFTEEPPF